MKISKKELKKLINESINYADGSKLDVDGENFKVYPKYGEMNLVIDMIKRVFAGRLFTAFEKESHITGVFKNHFKPELEVINELKDVIHLVIDMVASNKNTDTDSITVAITGQKGTQSDFASDVDHVHVLSKQILFEIINDDSFLSFSIVSHQGRKYITMNQSSFDMSISESSSLLSEVFNREGYSFTADDIECSYLGCSVSYEFSASDDINYDVIISSSEDSLDVFSVDFYTADTWYALTGKMDLRVFTTIVSIVKQFVFEDSLKFDVKLPNTLTFVSPVTQEHDGDIRRANIYQRLLKMNGIQSRLTGCEGIDNCNIIFSITR
tara:strand:- start:5958 stop:6932 length:975 start_codon:yes stop_codon:yes gene_type:complete